ncbi:MAG: hypothetical protein ACLQNE_28140 [Thermoguttaceae bacterium]
MAGEPVSAAANAMISRGVELWEAAVMSPVVRRHVLHMLLAHRRFEPYNPGIVIVHCDARVISTITDFGQVIFRLHEK